MSGKRSQNNTSHSRCLTKKNIFTCSEPPLAGPVQLVWSVQEPQSPESQWSHQEPHGPAKLGTESVLALSAVHSEHKEKDTK